MHKYAMIVDKLHQACIWCGVRLHIKGPDVPRASLVRKRRLERSLIELAYMCPVASCMVCEAAVESLMSEMHL